MTTKPINPELILRCGIETSRYDDFFPLHSADDREALQLRLEKEGWSFCSTTEDGPGSFYAVAEDGIQIIEAESHAVRLLASASAQWGIPMYAEGE